MILKYMMDMMQWYSLYLESTDVAIQVTKVCSSIDAAIVQQKKQAKLTDYCAKAFFTSSSSSTEYRFYIPCDDRRNFLHYDKTGVSIS